MSTYLSLDVDYWGMAGSDRHMFPFVQRVLELKKPTLVVRDHDKLLPHIDKYPCDRLINVDYHDDIVYRSAQDIGTGKLPEEGTWASYVAWRENAWFQWLHPHDKERILEGLCDPVEDVYADGSGTGWKRVTKRRGTSTIPWDDIVAVGIALSPGYWHRALCRGDFYPHVYHEDIGYYARTVKLLMGRRMKRSELRSGPLRRELRRAA